MDGISAISGVGKGRQLTLEQQAEVEKLAARDRDVRTHEAAHMTSAGALASGVEYTYRLGPDGQLYAVGGRVRISIPAGLSADQMLAAAQTLRAAANAPVDPSGQDQQVAAKATALEADAQEKINEQRTQSAPTTPGQNASNPTAGLDRFA
jgi:hypothetical protein